MKKANDEVLAGKVPFRTRERCWPVGVPGFDAYSPIEAFFFYQTPEKVVIIAQAGPEIRHIYLNVTHSKDVKPSWYGESVGHYENGDTLVIDSIGISAKSHHLVTSSHSLAYHGCGELFAVEVGEHLGL